MGTHGRASRRAHTRRAQAPALPLPLSHQPPLLPANGCSCELPFARTRVRVTPPTPNVCSLTWRAPPVHPLAAIRYYQMHYPLHHAGWAEPHTVACSSSSFGRPRLVGFVCAHQTLQGWSKCLGTNSCPPTDPQPHTQDPEPCAGCPQPAPASRPHGPHPVGRPPTGLDLHSSPQARSQADDCRRHQRRQRPQRSSCCGSCS